MAAETRSHNPNGSCYFGHRAEGFSTQPFNIIVSWNAATDEFFVDKDAVEASV
jgi:hypothetical protein